MRLFIFILFIYCHPDYKDAVKKTEKWTDIAHKLNLIIFFFFFLLDLSLKASRSSNSSSSEELLDIL